MSDDRYLSGDGVLVNNLGLRHRDILQDTEFKLTLVNAHAAMAMADRARDLSEAVWCRIHRELFGDLYPWAGKMRTVDIYKGDSTFAPAPALKGHADKVVLPRYRTQAAAAGSNDRAFAVCLAECWGELNFLHPFREGNGRATQIFVTALARRYGRSIDWCAVGYEEEIAAGKESVHGRYGGYEAILARAMGPGAPGPRIYNVWGAAVDWAICSIRQPPTSEAERSKGRRR